MRLGLGVRSRLGLKLGLGLGVGLGLGLGLGLHLRLDGVAQGEAIRTAVRRVGVLAVEHHAHLLGALLAVSRLSLTLALLLALPPLLALPALLALLGTDRR